MRMTQPYIVVPHHHRVDMADVLGEVTEDGNGKLPEQR